MELSDFDFNDLPASRPGSPSRAQDSLTALFNKALHTLPVQLQPFVDIAKRNPHLIFTEHIADRMIVTLLNEQDSRISDKNTKLQIIEIFRTVATSSRPLRIRMRIVLQNTEGWFDDEVDEAVRERTSKDGHGEQLPERDKEIVVRMKMMLSVCWHTPPHLLKSLVQDQNMRLRDCKHTILCTYATTAVQSIVRSKADRNKLKRNLKIQAEEQIVETREWSALIIQKTARGYIARNTILKSMHIRQNLSKEVLRIAETYLKNGDLWSFLKNINDELTRSNNVIAENQAQEDNWAANFVEKVIAKRQNEFNTSWEVFPKALSKFSGVAISSGTSNGGGASGSRIDSTGALLTKHGGSGHKSMNSTINTLSTIKTNITTNNTNTKRSTTNLNNTTNITRGMQHTLSASGSVAGNTDITVEEVRLAMRHDEQDAHLSVPGVLMRKALATTVEVEVAEQLNRLINGQYRSRKLVKDIRDVYGPHSDATHRPLSKSTSSLAPLKTHGGVKPPTKKKKRVGLNGQPLPQEMGRIDAAHSDYLSNSSVEYGSVVSGGGGGGGSGVGMLTRNNTASTINTIRTANTANTTRTINTANTTHTTHTINTANTNTAASHGTLHAIEPGLSLLTDIPQGINDTIERLLHAAALRCYVPDFFQGVHSWSGKTFF